MYQYYYTDLSFHYLGTGMVSMSCCGLGGHVLVWFSPKVGISCDSADECVEGGRTSSMEQDCALLHTCM